MQKLMGISSIITNMEFSYGCSWLSRTDVGLCDQRTPFSACALRHHDLKILPQLLLRRRLLVEPKLARFIRAEEGRSKEEVIAAVRDDLERPLSCAAAEPCRVQCAFLAWPGSQVGRDPTAPNTRASGPIETRVSASE